MRMINEVILVVSCFLQTPDSNGIISLQFGTQVQEIGGLKCNSSTCSFIICCHFTGLISISIFC